jgi:hypothetical protein
VKKKREGDIFQSVEVRPFIRTLSYRDFLTSGSLSLLLLALIRICMYAEEHGAGDLKSLSVASVGIALFFNHLLYKVEHKRSNNFIGRVIHGFIFIILFLALLTLGTYLNGRKLLIGEDVAALFIMVMGLSVMLLIVELFIFLLNRFFKLFKWRIL